MDSTMTLEAQREMHIAIARDLEAEGNYTCVVVQGRSFGNASALVTCLQNAEIRDVEEIARQLCAMEDKAVQRGRRDRSWAAEDARRRELASGKQTPAEQAAALVTTVEATVAAMDANSVEGRLGRVEDLLVRIADALEKR